MWTAAVFVAELPVRPQFPLSPFSYLAQQQSTTDEMSVSSQLRRVAPTRIECTLHLSHSTTLAEKEDDLALINKAIYVESPR